LVVPEGETKLAIRLPSSQRVIRTFSPTGTLTALYAWVDTQLIPGEFLAREDPMFSPGSTAEGAEGAIETQIAACSSPDEWWGFKLVLAYPRKEIEWKKGATLGEVSCLKSGGQLIVHMLQTSETRQSGDVDSDGYSSEDSEQ